MLRVVAMRSITTCVYLPLRSVAHGLVVNGGFEARKRLVTLGRSVCMLKGYLQPVCPLPGNQRSYIGLIERYLLLSTCCHAIGHVCIGSTSSIGQVWFVNEENE
jgi:hypothetical protein